MHSHCRYSILLLYYGQLVGEEWNEISKMVLSCSSLSKARAELQWWRRERTKSCNEATRQDKTRNRHKHYSRQWKGEYDCTISTCMQSILTYIAAIACSWDGAKVRVANWRVGLKMSLDHPSIPIPPPSRASIFNHISHPITSRTARIPTLEPPQAFSRPCHSSVHRLHSDHSRAAMPLLLLERLLRWVEEHHSPFWRIHWLGLMAWHGRDGERKKRNNLLDADKRQHIYWLAVTSDFFIPFYSPSTPPPVIFNSSRCFHLSRCLSITSIHSINLLKLHAHNWHAHNRTLESSNVHDV